MKHALRIPLLALAAVVPASALAATASASPSAAKLVIRHQLHGCHSWSANGDAYKPTQAIQLHRGGSISVTNNDVMPHKLIETSGSAVTFARLSTGMGMGLKGTFAPAMLPRMGSSSKLTFSKPGVYKFTTRPGEDFMAGIKTIGEDNVLRLVVTVS